MSKTHSQLFESSALAIGARIKMTLPGLNNTERRVANWFLAKGNITPQTTLRESAMALKVSEPLLVKVAKKMGCSGFRELREALTRYFAELPYDRELEITHNDSLDTVLAKVFAINIQTLKEAQSVADTDVIQKAARLAFNAHRVVIFAIGGSASVGQDFEHKLLRIGILAHAYSDYHLMLMAAAQLNTRDVVIAISQSGSTRELLNAVDAAKRQGTRIVCITNDNLSPLARRAHLSIFSPATRGPLLGQNAVARIIQLNLLDTLFIAIVLEDYNGNSRKLAQSLGAVSALHR